MYYITLDLEWNQAYAQKALAVQKRLACRLRGEVIQIGAVKMDSKMNICGSYQIIFFHNFFLSFLYIYYNIIYDKKQVFEKEKDAIKRP